MKTANDLGYGSVKAIVDGKKIKFPSVFAVEREQDIPSPVEFENKAQQDAYMEDFINRMDVTVSSSSIKTQGRFMIGNNAVSRNLPLTHFDINDFAGKAESDYSLILTLSMIAGRAVEEAYKKASQLFNKEYNYVDALDTISNAVEEVEPGAYKRITDDYESREQAQRQYPMN